MWQKLAWLAIAGALGTVARYGLSGWAQRAFGDVGEPRGWGDSAGGFPWGTLVVNVLGCFLFGLVWSLAESGLKLDGHVRLAVLTGFMGAFTTFSTYAFESGQMLRDSQWVFMAINMLAQNGLGLAAVLLGFALGRVIIF